MRDKVCAEEYWTRHSIIDWELENEDLLIHNTSPLQLPPATSFSGAAFFFSFEKEQPKIIIREKQKRIIKKKKIHLFFLIIFFS